MISMKSNKLNKDSFKETKIQLIDHRRLTDMLLKHKPSIYKMTSEPYDFLKEAREFYKFSYSIPTEKYYALLKNF